MASSACGAQRPALGVSCISRVGAAQPSPSPFSFVRSSSEACSQHEAYAGNPNRAARYLYSFPCGGSLLVSAPNSGTRIASSALVLVVPFVARQCRRRHSRLLRSLDASQMCAKKPKTEHASPAITDTALAQSPDPIPEEQQVAAAADSHPVPPLLPDLQKLRFKLEELFAQDSVVRRLASSEADGFVSCNAILAQPAIQSFFRQRLQARTVEERTAWILEAMRTSASVQTCRGDRGVWLRERTRWYRSADDELEGKELRPGVETDGRVVRVLESLTLVVVDGCTFAGCIPSGLLLRGPLKRGDRLRVLVLSIDAPSKRMVLIEADDQFHEQVIAARLQPVGTSVLGIVWKRASSKRGGDCLLVYMNGDPTCIGEIPIKGSEKFLSDCPTGSLLQDLEVVDVSPRGCDARATLRMPPTVPLPAELEQRIAIGATVTGEVRDVIPAGVRVELGGATGLIPIERVSGFLLDYCPGSALTLRVLNMSTVPRRLLLRELTSEELDCNEQRKDISGESLRHKMLDAILAVGYRLTNLIGAASVFEEYFAGGRGNASMKGRAGAVTPRLPRVGSTVRGIVEKVEKNGTELKIRVSKPPCHGVLRRAGSTGGSFTAGARIEGLRVVDLVGGESGVRPLLEMPVQMSRQLEVGGVRSGYILGRLQSGILVDLSGDFLGHIDRSLLGRPFSEYRDGEKVDTRVLAFDPDARRLTLREIRQDIGEKRLNPSGLLPAVGSEVDGTVVSTCPCPWPEYQCADGRVLFVALTESTTAVVQPETLMGGIAQYPVGTTLREMVVVDVVVAPWDEVLVAVKGARSGCFSKDLRIGATLNGNVCAVLEKGGIMVDVGEHYAGFVQYRKLLKPREEYKVGDRLKLRLLDYDLAARRMRLREVQPDEPFKLPDDAPLLPQVGSVVEGVVCLLPSSPIAALPAPSSSSPTAALPEPSGSSDTGKEMVWDEYPVDEDENDEEEPETSEDSRSEAQTDENDAIVVSHEMVAAARGGIIVQIKEVPCLAVIPGDKAPGGQSFYPKGSLVTDLTVIDVVVHGDSAWPVLMGQRFDIEAGGIVKNDVVGGTVFSVLEFGMLVDVGLLGTDGTPFAAFCRWRNMPLTPDSYSKGDRVEGLRVTDIDLAAKPPRVLLKGWSPQADQDIAFEVGVRVDAIVLEVFPLNGLVVDLGNDVEGFVPAHALASRTGAYTRCQQLRGLYIIDRDVNLAGGCELLLSELPPVSDTDAVAKVRSGSIVYASVVECIDRAVFVDYAEKTRGRLEANTLWRDGPSSYSSGDKLILVATSVHRDGGLVFRELWDDELTDLIESGILPAPVPEWLNRGSTPVQYLQAEDEEKQAHGDLSAIKVEMKEALGEAEDQRDGKAASEEVEDTASPASEGVLDQGASKDTAPLRSDVATMVPAAGQTEDPWSKMPCGVLVPASKAVPAVGSEVQCVSLGRLIEWSQLPEIYDFLPAEIDGEEHQQTEASREERAGAESIGGSGDYLLMKVSEPSCIGIVVVDEAPGSAECYPRGREVADAFVADVGVRGGQTFAVLQIRRRRLYSFKLGEELCGIVAGVQPEALEIDVGAEEPGILRVEHLRGGAKALENYTTGGFVDKLQVLECNERTKALALTMGSAAGLRKATELQEGEILEGRVTAISSYGVFFDVFCDQLILCYINELVNPTSAYTVGQMVDDLEVIWNEGCLKPNLRQQGTDSGSLESQRKLFGISVGERVAGTVVTVLPYGLILDLDGLARDGFCDTSDKETAPGDTGTVEAIPSAPKFSIGDRFEGLEVSALHLVGDIEVVLPSVETTEAQS